MNKKNEIGREEIPFLNRKNYIDDIGKSKEKKHGQSGEENWVLVLGQDQLTPKAFYYANELKKENVKTYFLSRDTSGVSRENIEKFDLNADIIPKSLFKHWKIYCGLLKKYKPKHIELFLGVKPWSLVFYLFMAKVHRIPILIWCRGNEILKWTKHHPIRRVVNRLAFKCSKVVLLRELYMESIIKEHKIVDRKKLRFCHNAVPVPEMEISKRKPIVLFLNTLKAWRNPLLIVEAANKVLKKYPEAEFKFVGGTAHLDSYNPMPNEIEFQVNETIEKYGIGDRVKVLPFTNDSSKYFHESKIFLLPADIVFCNNSLIESMAHGVVPIVADVQGSDKIVEDGVSGYIVEKDADIMAEKIMGLIEDDELADKMAKAARARIIERFNSKSTAKNLMGLYIEELWK